MNIFKAIFGKRKQWERLGETWTARAIEYQFRNLIIDVENIFMRDRDYRAIPAADFERLVFDSWYVHDNPAYRPEIFDCDDFAVCFLADVRRAWAERSRGVEALAFGYVFAILAGGDPHAFIWALDPSGEIRYYEPQTGNAFTPIIEKIILVEN